MVSARGISTDPDKIKAVTEWSPLTTVLTKELTEAPILGFPEEKGQWIVDTDASDTGLGAVLSQVQNKKERVIMFGSRSLSKPERNYCVTQRQLLAVVFAIRKIQTISQPAVHHQNRPQFPSLVVSFQGGQMARWLLDISTYDLEIQHRPGRQHNNADGLSRAHCSQCGREEETKQKE